MKMALSKAILTGLMASTGLTALSPCAHVSQVLSNGSSVSIPAGQLVHDCLTSVPFKKDDAKGFLGKYRSTLEFHSTLAWLKSPPPGYQQPATDIMGGLDEIGSKVDQGSFTNQYDFELALLRLLQTAHDAHLYFVGGASSVFGFNLPMPLVSLSEDGVSLPKVYCYIDMAQATNTGSSSLSWSPSAVQTINGQDSVDWMTNFAAKYATGGLEPHTDWNTLFYSAVILASGYPMSVSSNNRYFDERWFNVTFANGSRYAQEVSANLQDKSFKEIDTGEQFYESFVAESTSTSSASAFASASEIVSDQVQTAAPTSQGLATATTQAQPSNWAQFKPDLTAFPTNPAVVQSGFGQGGYLTGYFYPPQSLAVLSIPSFMMNGVYAETFSASVNEFIVKAKASGLQKVLIDLRSNPGGDALLSMELLKNFFPTSVSILWSRMRAHTTANLLGEAFTGAFMGSDIPQDEKKFLVNSPWVAMSYTNPATGKAFQSWDELSQNYTQKGDLFTTTLNWNFSNVAWDLGGSGYGIIIDGYANRTNESPQPYAVADVAVLFDGLCASTCAIAGELFNEVGVKSIVVGGRPQYGKMQAIGSVRGSQAYTQESLNTDFARLRSQGLNDSRLPDPRDYYKVKAAGFNLRDTVRGNDTFPLQFEYEPADCRIFYTPQTFNNYTNLWLYAANALWGNGTCVQESTGGGCDNATTTSSNGTCATNGTSGTPPSPTSSGYSIITGAASKATSMGLTMFVIASLAALL